MEMCGEVGKVRCGMVRCGRDCWEPLPATVLQGLQCTLVILIQLRALHSITAGTSNVLVKIKHTVGKDTVINSQSLEDTQVGYISQNYTLDKHTLDKHALEKIHFKKYITST